MRHLNIIADAHIWGAQSAFTDLPGFDVRLHMLENQEITRQTLIDTDILLTRSSIRVNKALLAGTPVRFAATATIGDDHFDKQWLDSNNIAWANAAGSSTGSVVEYILTLLLDLQQRKLMDIPGSTIGIIGAGRIGSQLACICRNIGMKVMLNDPPRAKAEGKEGFCALEDVLAQADLITLHTPLIASGEDCTRHLLNEERLTAFNGRGIINAARGICLDNTALLGWLNRDLSHFAALDCWEDEPEPLAALLKHTQLAIATPHIAGHSLDGKAANTLFAYRALCRYLDVQPQWDINRQLPAAPLPVTIQTIENDPWRNLHAAVNRLYPLAEDNKVMKSWSGLTSSELASAFTAYRRHYPLRRAWQLSPVHFTHADAETRRLADAIGLNLV